MSGTPPETRSAPWRALVTGSSWVMLAEGLALPTGLLTAAFLTRHLGPDGYGLFTLSATIAGWFGTALLTLFSRAAIKTISAAPDWHPVAAAILGRQLAAGMAVAALLALGAGPLAEALRVDGLVLPLRLLALETVCFTLAHGYRAVLIGLGRYRDRALAGAVRWVSRLVFIVAFVAAGLGVAGAALGSLLSALCELAMNASGVRVRPSLRLAPPPDFWRLVVPVASSAVALRLSDRLDLLLLVLYGASPADAGFYGAAQNLTYAASIVSMSISPLLLSTVTRLLRAGDAAMAGAVVSAAMRLIVCLFPFAVIAATSAEAFAALLFGAPFRAAGPVFAVLSVGALANLWVTLATAVMVGYGRASWTVGVGLPVPLLLAAGAAVLVPRIGMLGAAVASTASLWAAGIAATVLVMRLDGVRLPLATLARSSVAAVVCGVAGHLWQAEGVAVLGELLLLSAVAVALLFLLGERIGQVSMAHEVGVTTP